MNRLNYAQHSNFIAGCSQLFKYEFYVQEINLPGLNINVYDSYNQGMKHLLTGDSITHTELNLTVMLDEDFLVYQAFKEWMEGCVNQTSGSFAERDFTFYCDIHNNKGNYLFTVMFYGCKMLSLSDVQMSAQDDTPSNSVSVSIDYDWFEFKRSGLPSSWKKDFNITEIDSTDDQDSETDQTEDIKIEDECDCLMDGDKIKAEPCEFATCDDFTGYSEMHNCNCECKSGCECKCNNKCRNKK